jgi:hypothetical protein
MARQASLEYISKVIDHGGGAWKNVSNPPSLGCTLRESRNWPNCRDAANETNEFTPPRSPPLMLRIGILGAISTAAD